MRLTSNDMDSVFSPPSFASCVPQASGGWVTDQHTSGTHHRSTTKHTPMPGKGITRNTEVSMDRPTTRRVGGHDAAIVASIAQCLMVCAIRQLVALCSAYMICA